MENVMLGLSYGVLGSLTAILIITLAGKAKRRFLDHSLSVFWNFKHKSVVIIHPIYYGQLGEEMPPSMARIEDVLAMQCLTSFFKERCIEYKLQDDTQEIPQDSDLILVCSPKGNKQSLKFAERHRLPFKFSRKNDNPSVPYFVDIKTGREYWSQVDKSGQNFDVGLIGRFTDDNPPRRVFLLWGIHGFGTLGVSQFVVSSGRNLRAVVKEIGDRDFAVLVEAPFSTPREVGEATILAPPRFLGKY